MSRLPSKHAPHIAALLACLLTACFTYIDGPGLPPASGERVTTPIILSPREAREVLLSDGAVILDVRDTTSFRADHIEGAQRVSWQQFSRDDAPYRGLLSGDIDALERELGARGVANERAVLVVGEPRDGWGEDGRIVWMLRALGHEGAAIVDGGHAALAEALDASEGAIILTSPVAFEAAPTGDLTATIEEVERELTGEGVILLDTREAREFDGDVPYGEARGGHLPGAAHLHFEQLIDPTTGSLRGEDQLREEFSALGITPDSEIIAYCTGGVRSAWVVMVLRHLGYRGAKNYAGSMWEWSAGDAGRYPLE